MSGLWCDLQFYHGFQVLESRSVLLLVEFARSEDFVQVDSQIGINFRNQTEDWFDKFGLIRTDFGELGHLCIPLTRYGDSVVLVTVSAILMSIIVGIGWEISKFAVSGNFSNGVTVPMVFLSDG